MIGQMGWEAVTNKALPWLGRREATSSWTGRNISATALWQPTGSAVRASIFPGHGFSRKFYMRVHECDIDDELHDDLSQLTAFMVRSAYGSAPRRGRYMLATAAPSS